MCRRRPHNQADRERLLRDAFQSVDIADRPVVSTATGIVEQASALEPHLGAVRQIINDPREVRRAAEGERPYVTSPRLGRIKEGAGAPELPEVIP
jgi:hypothetical protein